jgi:hypothetical protein
MMKRIMADRVGEKTSFPFWFKIAVGAVSAVVLIGIYLLLKTQSTPGSVLDDYITALAHQRCGKAYSLVSFSAKNNFSGYKNYDNFMKSVCAPVAKKYTFLEMYKVEDTIENGDSASVLCRLRFKTYWMPKSDFRALTFNLVHEDGKWLVDGPELQP